MLTRLKLALQVRVAIILALLHVGLIASGVGLWKLSPVASQLPPDTLSWLVAGVVSLYGSFIVMVLFVLIPAWPWIQRARRLKEWQTWVFEILPQLMALMPLILAGFKIVKSTWEEFQETGNWAVLDPEKIVKRVKTAAAKETAKANRKSKDSDE
jgi:hypothetical protein